MLALIYEVILLICCTYIEWFKPHICWYHHLRIWKICYEKHFNCTFILWFVLCIWSQTFLNKKIKRLIDSLKPQQIQHNIDCDHRKVKVLISYPLCTWTTSQGSLPCYHVHKLVLILHAYITPILVSQT
jgi:hypothetical protein